MGKYKILTGESPVAILVILIKNNDIGIMKTRVLLLGACVTLVVSCGVTKEGTTRKAYYIEKDRMPDAVAFLPAPPVNGSELFLTDSVCYERGKDLRDTPRGAQAVADADHTTKYYMEYFAPELGVLITKENSPFLFNFLDISIRNIRASISGAKAAYMRKRPFVYFHEPSARPEADADLGKTGSYPSGHSIRGWGLALILSEICPESAEAILKKGYEYGQSRVILGVHYQSDLDAARLAASAAVAALHSDEAFQKDLAKAKIEFRKLKKTLSL